MPGSEPPQCANASDATDRVAPSWRSWLAVFAGAAVLYALTARRGAQWQDSGMHILRAVTGDLYGAYGLALVHPLHHWLARLAAAMDFVEPSFAITLISAVAGAVTVANTFGCIVTLSGNRRAALLAAGALAVAHTFWQAATLVETYTLATALFSGECWCLAVYAMTHRRGALLTALMLNGLGVANHLLAGLTTPILACVMLHAVYTRRVSLRIAVAAAGLWLLGSLPYTALILVATLRSGDFAGTLHSALFGQSFADEVLNTALSLRGLLITIGFVLLSFPNALLPLAAYGLIRARRFGIPVIAVRALSAGLAIHVLFAVRYNVVDQHTFFMLAYVLAAVFGGIGYAVVERNARSPSRLFALAAITLAATPVLYALTPTVARRFNVLRAVERHKPYRDDYVYVFTPWSVVERSAETMSRHAVELAGETGLIIVEDSMALFAVRYRALRADRPGVHIVHKVTEVQLESAAGAGRPVVIVPKNRAAPRTKLPTRLGQWQRAGDLFVLQVSRTES